LYDLVRVGVICVLVYQMIFFVTGDEDYTPTVVNVTFPAGVTIVNITVPVVSDLVVEDTEMFHVRIDELPDQPVTIAEQNTSLGIIIDDDTPCKETTFIGVLWSICVLAVTVSFNTTVVRDDESAGSLTFILVTNRPANESFTVQVCTEDIDLGPDLGIASGIDLLVSTELWEWYNTIKSNVLMDT